MVVFCRKHSIQDSQTSRKSSINEKNSQTSRKSSSSSTSSSNSKLDSLSLARSPLGFDSLSPRKSFQALDPLNPRQAGASLPHSRFTCSPVHGEEEAAGGLRKASIIKDPASRKSSGQDSRRSSCSQVSYCIDSFNAGERRQFEI